MTEKPIPAIVYAVKSSPDEKESVADQHRQVLEAIEREGGRHVVAPPFGEANASGFRKERGPQLEAAIDAATDAATEHGQAELWVFHSSRLARGDGRKGHRSVNLVVATLLYENVTVRSVSDPAFVTPMLAGIGGEAAHKYSADLSAHVKRGKLQQLARGDHLGGPTCDGYLIVREHDSDGRVTGRAFRFDPDRVELVRRIFDLATQGIGDAPIARRLNSEGARTRHDRPYDRRAVQNMLTNPFYAGRIAYKRGTPDEQIVKGQHPPLVDPAEFDRIQRLRQQRDLAEPREHIIGRPAQNHALAKLARCICGERMYPVTSSYRRKDGSRARTYACHAYQFGTGTCNAKPVDAELVDAAVIAGLDGLLVDFEGWRSRIEDGHTAERDRLAGEVERARDDHDRQAHKATAVEAKWGEYVAEGDDDKANLVLPIVQRERAAVAPTERRLQAAHDALASIPAEAPADAMLDFANALQEAISGRVDKSGTMAEVNQALRELFACFLISETTGDNLFDGILIQPWLRVGVIAPPSDPELGWAWPVLVKATDDPPPLRWLEATPERNEQNSQA